jgi:uncharacterized protein
MIIDIGRLSPHGDTLEGEDPAELWQLQGAEEVSAAAPVRYRVNVTLISGELIVRGVLVSKVGFCCSRCGVGFTQEVREANFSSAREVEAGVQTVDLTDEVRETMILAFPTYPLCRTDCKGLCTQCGRNLNEGPCGCRPPEDRRWDQLDKLQVTP